MGKEEGDREPERRGWWGKFVRALRKMLTFLTLQGISRRWWGCFNLLSHVASARCEPSTLLTHNIETQNTSTHCSLAPWYSDGATLKCFSSYIRRHIIKGRCFLRPRKRSQAKSKEALTWESKEKFILRAFSTKIEKNYLLNQPKSSNLGYLGVSYLNWTGFHQPLNTSNIEQLQATSECCNAIRVKTFELWSLRKKV